MATIFSEETRRNSTLRRTRFEMWVGIEEDGRRTAVQIKDKVGCTTGGVFKLRQNQSHNILVRVVPIINRGEHINPVECESITSISVSSVCRKHQNEPLDSYYETDLERLRTILTDSNTLHDAGEIQSLLDQSDAGPRTLVNLQVPPGMETKIPIIFIEEATERERDSGQLRVNSGQLPGEESKSKSLPIIRTGKDFENGMAQYEATARWDLSDEPSPEFLLKEVTSTKMRVYAILKVGILLKNPSKVELMLKKRISLKIYCESQFKTAMRKPFEKQTHTSCGVMFEVISISMNVTMPAEEGENKADGSLEVVEENTFRNTPATNVESLISRLETHLVEEKVYRSLSYELVRNDEVTTEEEPFRTIPPSEDTTADNFSQNRPSYQDRSTIFYKYHENDCRKGDLVEVQLRKTQFGKGVVQFVGEVHFDEGLWIGVKLNQPRGEHNGTYRGRKYFTCKDKHGILVKRNRLIRYPTIKLKRSKTEPNFKDIVPIEKERRNSELQRRPRLAVKKHSAFLESTATNVRTDENQSPEKDEMKPWPYSRKVKGFAGTCDQKDIEQYGIEVHMQSPKELTRTNDDKSQPEHEDTTGKACDVFREFIPQLSEAIGNSAMVIILANAMWSWRLLTTNDRDRIEVKTDTIPRVRGIELFEAIYRRLSHENDEEQQLLLIYTVCIVLEEQEEPLLIQIAKKIMAKLSMISS